MNMDDRDLRIGIIWPERRWVTAHQICTWAHDAVANGYIYKADAPDYSDPMLCAEALHDAGVITLGEDRCFRE